MNPSRDIIEHNYPNMTEVVNAPHPPAGLTFPVNYSLSMEQIVSLINISGSCFQYLRYDCYHSRLGYTHRYWADRFGDWKTYFPGGPPDGNGCACGITRTCPSKSKFIIIMFITIFK